MFNPLEFKHDITSRPLLWMLDRARESDNPPTDAHAFAFTVMGIYTAAVNLYPAAFLIQAGVRGDMLYSHTTFKRFNPWLAPIFHYTQAASKAEQIGASIGRPIGKFLSADIWPVTGKTRKAWQKAGVKGGAKLGARVGGRLIPGVGWALLAYDVYDIAFNQSLWGFDFA